MMLNKGDHVTEAITVLDDVLRRMQRHHRKKRSLLSRLEAWDDPRGSRADQTAGSGRP